MITESINTILVHVPKTYEDEIRYKSLRLYLDTRFNDIKHTIRYGEVVDSPDGRFKKGDIIYFHHNIVRRIRTMEGTEKESPDSFLDNLFCVPSDGVYARQHGDNFESIEPYCFIKPIPKKEKEVSGLKVISNETEEAQWGIVRFGNKELETQGVHEGDTIIFNKNSEYEYPINDEKLYRMETSWIIGKLVE